MHHMYVKPVCRQDRLVRRRTMRRMATLAKLAHQFPLTRVPPSTDAHMMERLSKRRSLPRTSLRLSKLSRQESVLGPEEFWTASASMRMVSMVRRGEDLESDRCESALR